MINLGNGRPYLLKHFISLVEKCVGKKAVIEVLPEQPGDVDRTCADISKAERLLGYKPQVPFEEGISRTVEWYRTMRQQVLVDEEEKPVPVCLQTPSTEISSEVTSLEDADDEDEGREELELSSYVQKATHQYQTRRRRFLSF